MLKLSKTDLCWHRTRTELCSPVHTVILWGSEYQTSLVFKWSKRGWMPTGPVFECHLNTGQPNHLNMRQMHAILFSYILVGFSNGWSSTQDIAHNWTFKIRASKSSVFKCFWYSNGRYSDPQCTQVQDRSVLRPTLAEVFSPVLELSMDRWQDFVFNYSSMRIEMFHCCSLFLASK